jgi:hypothetical protein
MDILDTDGQLISNPFHNWLQNFNSINTAKSWAITRGKSLAITTYSSYKFCIQQIIYSNLQPTVMQRWLQSEVIKENKCHTLIHTEKKKHYFTAHGPGVNYIMLVAFNSEQRWLTCGRVEVKVLSTTLSLGLVPFGNASNNRGWCQPLLLQSLKPKQWKILWWCIPHKLNKASYIDCTKNIAPRSRGELI